MTDVTTNRPIEPPEWLATYLALGQAFAEMRRALKRTTTPDKISLTEAVLLLAISETNEHGITQSQLVQRVALSPAQVSGQLESLARRQLASASRPSSDRRCQRWQATENGMIMTYKWLSLLPAQADRIVDTIARDLGSPLEAEERRAA